LRTRRIDFFSTGCGIIGCMEFGPKTHIPRAPENEQGSNKIEKAPSPLVVEHFPPNFRSRIEQYIQSLERESRRFNFQSIMVSPIEHESQEFMNEAKGRFNLPLDWPGTEFAAEFAKVFEKIQAEGFDGTPDELLLRWIQLENEKEIESVIEASEQNGGMISPNEIGLNMSTRSGRVDKAFRISMSNNKKGVLFIYDSRKMQNLSPEERKKDLVFEAGYGYKPKEGGTYRDALLALVAMH
jgi:hypothetical protein